MTITESQVRRIMPKANSDNVTSFVATMNKWSNAFGIDTKLRMAHFVAQVAHESSELNATTENLNYSAERLLKVFPKYFTAERAKEYAHNPEKIANRVYASRMGNGDERSGDGWRYRGRGLLQVTGRMNYKAYADSPNCVGDLMAHPEWLSQYPGALKSALWYWQSRGLNAFADKDDITLVTKRINGGTNGLSSRMYYLRKAKRVFGL